MRVEACRAGASLMSGVYHACGLVFRYSTRTIRVHSLSCAWKAASAPSPRTHPRDTTGASAASHSHTAASSPPSLRLHKDHANKNAADPDSRRDKRLPHQQHGAPRHHPHGARIDPRHVVPGTSVSITCHERHRQPISVGVGGCSRALIRVPGTPSISTPARRPRGPSPARR